MLIRSVKDPQYKRPRYGECGAMFAMAKDGHWYCVRRYEQVDESVCERCDKRDWPGCGERR